MKKRIFAIVLCLFVLAGTLIVPAVAESFLEDEPNILTYKYLEQAFSESEKFDFLYLVGDSTIVFQCDKQYANSRVSFWLDLADMLAAYQSITGYSHNLCNCITVSGDFGNGTFRYRSEDSLLSILDMSLGYSAFYHGGTDLFYEVILDENATFVWRRPYIANQDVWDIDELVRDPLLWPSIIDIADMPGYSFGDRYDEGFTDGQKQGFVEGYEKAKEEVLSQYGFLFNNVFKNATYTLYYTTDSTALSEYKSLTITPSFPMGGVVFDVGKIFYDVFYDEREPDNLPRIDHYYIEISWSDENVLDIRSNTIYVSGSAPMASATFYTIDGKSYVSDQMTTTKGDILTPEGITGTTCYVNRVEISYGGFQVGRDRVHELYCSNVVYNDGYANGYAAAMNTEGAKFTEAAYNSGYEKGFDVGKAEGQYIAETGNFNSLIFSVVQAPVNAFQSLFNFEILGVNMQDFVGGLLVLCVVLIAVKWVI